MERGPCCSDDPWWEQQGTQLFSVWFFKIARTKNSRDRGVTDDLTGRAKYSAKAAQSYKMVLDKNTADLNVVRQEIQQLLATHVDGEEDLVCLFSQLFLTL